MTRCCTLRHDVTVSGYADLPTAASQERFRQSFVDRPLQEDAEDVETVYIMLEPTRSSNSGYQVQRFPISAVERIEEFDMHRRDNVKGFCLDKRRLVMYVKSTGDDDNNDSRAQAERQMVIVFASENTRQQFMKECTDAGYVGQSVASVKKLFDLPFESINFIKDGANDNIILGEGSFATVCITVWCGDQGHGIGGCCCEQTACAINILNVGVFLPCHSGIPLPTLPWWYTFTYTAIESWTNYRAMSHWCASLLNRCLRHAHSRCAM